MDSNENPTNPILFPPQLDIQTYRQFLDLTGHLSQGIVLIDPSTKLPVEFNSTAHELLGYSRDQFSLIRLQDREQAGDSQFLNILTNTTGLETGVSFSVSLLNKSDELRQISAYLKKVNLGGSEFLQLIFEDITDRSKVDELTRAEREIFEICNSAGSKNDLIHKLLSFFKSFTACEAVGIRLQSGDDFPYYETSGFPDQFIELERSLCAYNPDGKVFRDHKGDPVLECMCDNIIGGRYDQEKAYFTDHGSFWSGNTSKFLATTTGNDRRSRTRNRCIGSGYESVALVPIRHNGKTFGLFQFNDNRIGWHTLEKVEILEHLVDYVAIAMAKLESDQALLESEKDFREIFNSTTEAILIHDAETGKVLDVNETMLKMYGFATKAEALEHTISDFSEGEETDSLARALALVKKASTEGPQVFEWLGKKSNGKTFWTEVVLNRSMISGKNRVLAVVRDISERKRMEEALNSYTERYRLLFDEMIEGFALHEIILDDKNVPVDYRFLDVNPAFETLTGLNKSNLIGHTVKEVLPGTENYWIEKYGDIALHGGDLRYENFASELGKWYRVIAYCPKFGQFATVFEDITNKKKGDLALQESEEQFRSTFEQTAIGMCMVSINGIFLRLNAAFCQMVGYAPDELLGKSINFVTHPDDFGITNGKLQEPLINNSQYIQFEKRYIHKNGNIIFVSISSTLIRDSSGNPRHYVSQVQDITEKRKTAEALELRDKIFTHSVDMLFIAGFDGYFKVLNPAFENTLGWTIEEMMTRPWIDFVHPDDIWKTEEIGASQINKGIEILQFENRYLCKDGSYRWLSWNSFSYPNENIIVGVTRDITDRKALDETLRQSEERYHLIDEASSDLIYSLNLQGRFTHVNSAFCKKNGLIIDQILGKNHEELGFQPRLCEEWNKRISELISTNKTVVDEISETINNEPHYFEIVLDPMHDHEGNIIGIAGTTRDIDARKKAEIKVKEQVDELQRWNAVTLGREKRIIELKQEVNQLLGQLDLPPRYKSESNSGQNNGR